MIVGLNSEISFVDFRFNKKLVNYCIYLAAIDPFVGVLSRDVIFLVLLQQEDGLGECHRIETVPK